MFGSGGELVGRSVLEVVRKQSVVAAIDSALRGEAATDRVAFGTGGGRAADRSARRARGLGGDRRGGALHRRHQIERLQRIRKDFLDDFSHEVRTPLAGLKSAAETLRARRV